MAQVQGGRVEFEFTIAPEGGDQVRIGTIELLNRAHSSLLFSLLRNTDFADRFGVEAVEAGPSVRQYVLDRRASRPSGS